MIEYVDLTSRYRQVDGVVAGKMWADGVRVARFGKTPEPLSGRLARLTDRSRGDAACWEFTGYKNKRGYGWMHVGSETDGSRRRVLAHRLALELSGVEIPDGMFVLHTCDNPPCCNPAHLMVGTHTENMRQMHERGRSGQKRGERHHAAKLSDADVASIRERYVHGSAAALAAEFNIHPVYVKFLARGGGRGGRNH